MNPRFSSMCIIKTKSKAKKKLHPFFIDDSTKNIYGLLANIKTIKSLLMRIISDYITSSHTNAYNMQGQSNFPLKYYVVYDIFAGVRFCISTSLSHTHSLSLSLFSLFFLSRSCTPWKELNVSVWKMFHVHTLTPFYRFGHKMYNMCWSPVCMSSLTMA